MASVSSTSIGLAGEVFHLACSITVRDESSNGSLALSWTGPDESPVVSKGPIVVGEPVTSGGTISLMLQFASLFTSHGGQYTCQGDLVTGDTTYTVSVLQDVVVQGIVIMLN